jgi:hypothetical protein
MMEVMELQQTWIAIANDLIIVELSEIIKLVDKNNVTLG